MRTIRVTGKGQLSLAPDLTRITMTLEGLCPEYSETLRRSSEDTEALRELLSRFGIRQTSFSKYGEAYKTILAGTRRENCGGIAYV